MEKGRRWGKGVIYDGRKRAYVTRIIKGYIKVTRVVGRGQEMGGSREERGVDGGGVECKKEEGRAGDLC